MYLTFRPLRKTDTSAHKEVGDVETSHLQGALEIAGGRSNILLQRDALVKSKQGAQCTGEAGES